MFRILTCTSIHGHVNKPLDDMMEGGREGERERGGREREGGEKEREGGRERENIGIREERDNFLLVLITASLLY